MGSATWKPNSFVTADRYTDDASELPSSSYCWVAIPKFYDDNENSRGRFGAENTKGHSVCLSGNVPSAAELAAREGRLSAITVKIKINMYKPNECSFRLVYNVQNTGTSDSDYTDAGDGSKTIIATGTVPGSAVTKTFSMTSAVGTFNSIGSIADYAIRLYFYVPNRGTAYDALVYDVSITAEWTANTSTLFINPNGGTWSGSSSTQTFTQESGTTKSISVPTRSGYTFGGWLRTNKYGSITTTSGNAVYTYGSTNNATDYLKATWTKPLSFESASLTYLGNQVSTSNKVLANEGYIISAGVSAGKSLPSQYSRLQYLQSTGTQFIDTGIASQTDITATIDFEWTSLNGTTAVLSTYWGGSGQRYYVCFNRNGGTIEYGAGTSGTASVSTTWTLGTRYNFVAEMRTDRQKMWLNDELVANYESAANKEGSTTFYLFASHDLDESSQHWAEAKAKVYGCRIQDVYGTVMRDYIPCKRISDGVLGMYDLVEEQFYTNIGSGTFLSNESEPNPLPVTYQQVEYIQSTGTQFIDTGVKSYTNQIAILDFEWTSISGTSAILSSYTSGSGNNYYICFNRNGGTIEFRAGTSNRPTISQSWQANKRYKFMAEMTPTKQIIWIDNTRVANFTSNTANNNETTLYLFASHDMEESGEYYARASGKLYSCTMTDNYGMLVRDFVPCYRKSDNVIGLYDRVNGQFHTNIGSGTFLKGANITI